MGYYLAGFQVYGIDHRQQRYPFEFRMCDALRFAKHKAHLFDAIHASPPCQRFSAASANDLRNIGRRPDLLKPTRELLEEIGLPYVIENVPGAPMRNPGMLCGTMFNLTCKRGTLRRHRLFETNWNLEVPEHPEHEGPTIGVYGHGRNPGGTGGASAADCRTVMGIHWAGRDAVSQAIPPAYTRFIGEQLIKLV